LGLRDSLCLVSFIIGEQFPTYSSPHFDSSVSVRLFTYLIFSLYTPLLPPILGYSHSIQPSSLSFFSPR
jgi:hypothetical protein